MSTSAHLVDTENAQVAAQASSSTESVDVQTETSQEPTKTREELLAERALKRATRWKANHDLSEEHNKAGDELFAKEEYTGACARYVEATKLWSSNPTYYLNLATAYLKCELYVDATQAATRALSLDPKSIQARFRRGVARMEQRLLKAAKIDFETIIHHDPTFAAAQVSLDAVTKLIDSSSKLGTHQISDPQAQVPPSANDVDGTEAVDVDFGFPRYDDDKLELASLSDSSDCNHAGNGIACRFYNHQGCARHSECAFSHAPDEKSVRDDLGQNVCIYYLLSACKFGDLKCIYSHSKANLPSNRGWWNDAAQIAKVKQVMEMADKKVKEQRALDTLLLKLEASKGRKAKNSKKAGTAGNPQEATDKATTARPTKTKKKTSAGRKKSTMGNGMHSHYSVNYLSRITNTEEEMEQRMMNGGFTNDELDELASQGVKPWDEDAYAVLDALSYY